MKKPLFLIWVFLCLFALSACTSSGDANSGRSSVTNPNPALKEPPALTVVCGEETVEALRGTYSWTVLNGDGTGSTVSADSMHPLQAKEYMTPITFRPTIFSHADPFSVSLQFDVPPDEVSVRFWSTDLWGQTDAESETLTVEKLEFDNGTPHTGFSSHLKEHGCVYEVTARWSSAEKYSGTAHYSFYTQPGIRNSQAVN